MTITLHFTYEKITNITTGGVIYNYAIEPQTQIDGILLNRIRECFSDISGYFTKSKIKRIIEEIYIDTNERIVEITFNNDYYLKDNDLMLGGFICNIHV